MSRTQYEQASDVFLELLELPASQRQQALDARPDLEEGLRQAVAELLENHTNDGFLEQAAVDVEGLDRHAAASLPRQVGGYEILRQIGVGGMGCVYEVHQRSVGRSAALKIMHAVFDNEHARQRFQLEIDVLARLEHPGIARIYDAGFDASGTLERPYFVMELVDGVAVDRWVREQQPSIDQIVDLFLHICDPLEYAHQRGIIHRDLKPANLMVDTLGHPKVLDFGIARPTDQNPSLVPVSGDERSVVGTIAYMSPEQCSLDECVDIRTDVYSLGVVLYHLLTGTLPIDVKDLSVVRAARRVCEEAPRPPRHQGRRLTRDLEAIVLHALEKSPAQRYQSVSGLSEDLRRFRRGMPISARPPSRWTRAMGWAARHPIAAASVGASAVVLLIFVSTAAIIWWLAVQPHTVVSGPGEHEAQLRSIIGRPLNTWDDVRPSAPVVLQRPEALGGDWIVILDQYATQISAYSLNEPKRLLWSTASLDLTPPGAFTTKARQPLVQHSLVADFLPQLPGNEILVIVRMQPYSPTILRVLDSAGKVRYEVWHDGAIMNIVWLPAEQRLLCCGYNNERNWFQRGVDLQDQMWPLVVFALEITDGHSKLNDYITSPDRMDPTVSWYRWVGPLENLAACDYLSASMLAMRVSTSSGFAAQFMITVDEDGSDYVALLLDGDGNGIDRVVTDAYRASYGRGQLPDPKSWQLFDYASLPVPDPAEPSR